MSYEFTIEAVVDEKNRVHHQFQVDGKWYDATVFRIDGRGYDRLMSMVGEVATNQESDQLDPFDEGVNYSEEGPSYEMAMFGYSEEQIEAIPPNEVNTFSYA